MSAIVFNGLRIFFANEQGNCTQLSDAGDFWANESGALLHYIDDDDRIVWEMRDNLKKIVEYVERGTESRGALLAAAAVLAIREFWGKHRPRCALWMGKPNRAAIGVSKMMPIFHDENLLYVVSPEAEEATEQNIVPIRAASGSLPLPEHFFDVAVLDAAAIASDRIAQIILSLRVGGLLLVFLPAGVEFPEAIPGAERLADEAGNVLLYVRLTREKAAMLRERTAAGQLARQKRLIAYILDEVGGALGSILASSDEARLDAAIAQASLAEDTLLPIYEELLSEDVKYLANRFKESLIEFRLHWDETTRRRVMDDYFALRREMKEKDDF